MSMVKLNVLKIDGNSDYAIELEPRATLAKLWAQIGDKENCDTCLISLLKQNEFLDSFSKASPIFECGIVDGDTLTLVKKPAPKILSCSFDNTAKLWNGLTGECLCTLELRFDRVSTGRFSEDGKWVLTVSRYEARVWDAFTGELKSILAAQEGTALLSAMFSTDACQILTPCTDNTVTIWETETGERKLTLFGHRASVRAAIFSRDGTKVVTASEDNKIKIWNPITGSCTLSLSKWSFFQWGSFLSPDGNYIVTRKRRRVNNHIWCMYILNADDGSCEQIIKAHDDRINSGMFSNDNTYLVSASQDGTAKVWNVSTGCIQLVLSGHEEAVHFAQFFPDGSAILTVGLDGTVKIWDTVIGVCKHSLTTRKNPYPWPLQFAALSSDGAFVVTVMSGNYTAIATWDSFTGECKAMLIGHRSVVASVSFSPVGVVPCTA